MKKLISVAVALLMMVSMSVTALAATDLGTNPATDKEAGDYAVGVNGKYQAADPATDVISVDISWADMEFTYIEGDAGTWNPLTHEYENKGTGAWNDHKATITVKNHSNVEVDAAFSFTASSDSFSGDFYAQSDAASAMTNAKLSLESAVGKSLDHTPSGTIYFGLGSSCGSISADGSLGTITINIAKKTA